MTENGMILRQDDALMPTSFAGVMQMGDALFKSGLLPQEIKSGSAAMAIILTGRELGIGPMLALRSVYVVKGKPTLSAQLMGALILRAGHSYTIKQSTNEACTIEFKRQSGATYTHTFTLADAKAAQLGGQTWASYPKAMLFSRCMSAGARAFLPDVIANMYTPEEMASVSAAEVVDAQTVNVETGEIAKPEPTGGNGHAEEKTKPHWFDQPGVQGRFWALAGSLGLDQPGVHEALEVGHIREYAGTMAEAKNALEAHAARQKAVAESIAQDKAQVAKDQALKVTA